MTGWRYTCDIKKHFIDRQPDYSGEDDLYDDEKFARSRDAIVAELKRIPLYGRCLDLEMITEELAAAQDVDEFNGWLTPLYDWADENRIWLGL